MKKRLLISLFLLLALGALSACGNAAQQTTLSSGQTAQYVPDTKGGDDYYERLLACRSEIEAITDFKPEAVIVLGTGLGDYADRLEVETAIPYSDIKTWPNTTVSDHKGNLIFANYKGLKLALMQGRIHYYEGYDINDVVLPLRVLHLLGADTVILTNAVGAINENYHVGDFVCVRDHISSFVPSPLVGENIDELGERFTGMTNTYDQEMQDYVLGLGASLGIPVHSGVFLQTTGPQFETPAEIRFYRQIGADTVGMSSAVEAITAAHMGMRICMINSVTNMAAGMEEEDFTSESIDESSKASAENFAALVTGLLDHLAETKNE